MEFDAASSYIEKIKIDRETLHSVKEGKFLHSC